MNVLLAGEKRRLALAATVAAAIVAAFVFLVRLPTATTLPVPVPGRAPVESRPTVQLARPTRSDALLAELIELRDMRPLFLPTNRNVSLPEPRLEPGRTFLDSDTLKLNFIQAELNVDKDLPHPVTLAGKPPDRARPADALVPDAAAPSLAGFGRNEPVIAPAEERGAYVEVYSVESGRRLWGVKVDMAARPTIDKPWAPIEFLAAADAAGLTAPLVLTESSRVEEVDAHFRKYLVQTLRIGARLAPGFYRIVVAP